MKPQVKAPVSCLMRLSTKGGKNPPRPPAAPTSRSLPTACGKYCGTSLICQYMLIWYVNNPEETSYYVRRLEGAWQPLVFVNVILNWVVPFVVLLPRATKCNPAVLSKVALVVMLGRGLDLALMVLPTLPEQQPWLWVLDLALLLGGGGLFCLVIFSSLGKAPLVPIQRSGRGQDLSPGFLVQLDSLPPAPNPVSLFDLAGHENLTLR